MGATAIARVPSVASPNSLVRDVTWPGVLDPSLASCSWFVFVFVSINAFHRLVLKPAPTVYREGRPAHTAAARV
jgi:hypothetical protein